MDKDLTEEVIKIMDELTEGELEEEMYILDLQEQDILTSIANDYWWYVHNN